MSAGTTQSGKTNQQPGVGKAVVNASTPPKGMPDSGLTFHVARSLEQVTAAWKLVYYRYHENGLIDDNDFAIHCTPFAVQHRSVIIYGAKSGEVASTITVMNDTDAGLPLDGVYPNELNELRRQGHRLLEVGLLADRRSSMRRFIVAMHHLMRYPYFWGKHLDMDILCGVHPHHADFYKKQLGFEQIGPVKQYATVNDHLVVPLRMNVAEVLKRPHLPKINAIFEQNPLHEQAFDGRYRFNTADLTGSTLGGYLLQQHGPSAMQHVSETTMPSQGPEAWQPRRSA